MANGSMSGCNYMRHSYRAYCGPGFIYIATDGEVFKIGCTREGGSAKHVYKSAGILAGVASRFRSLNKNKQGRSFKMLHVIYTPICVKALESVLHDLFAEKRVGKEEWFLLSETDYHFLCNIESFDGYQLTHLGIKP